MKQEPISKQDIRKLKQSIDSVEKTISKTGGFSKRTYLECKLFPEFSAFTKEYFLVFKTLHEPETSVKNPQKFTKQIDKTISVAKILLKKVQTKQAKQEITRTIRSLQKLKVHFTKFSKLVQNLYKKLSQQRFSESDEYYEDDDITDSIDEEDPELIRKKMEIGKKAFGVIKGMGVGLLSLYVLFQLSVITIAYWILYRLVHIRVKSLRMSQIRKVITNLIKLVRNESIDIIYRVVLTLYSILFVFIVVKRGIRLIQGVVAIITLLFVKLPDYNI